MTQENWKDKTCHECGCRHGDVHSMGCDMEVCPFCGGQLISCSCCYKQLGYDENNLPKSIENNGLEDEDYFRWVDILTAKGRIPYQSPWQPGIADNVWTEFVHPNGHCSLCGNSGIINTLGVKTPAGWKVGARSYCICPNGRGMKKGAGKKEWSPHPLGDSIIDYDPIPYKSIFDPTEIPYDPAYWKDK